MATCKFNGMEEYERMLSELAEFDTVQEVCGETIYAGADVVADQIHKNIEALPTHTGMKHGTATDPIDTITIRQKEGLLDGFGISPMQYRDGYYSVKIGFDGYNKVKTRRRSHGQPNAMIARSIEHGTYFRAKTPFISTAIKESKNKAEKAMEAAFDKSFENHTKGK